MIRLTKTNEIVCFSLFCFFYSVCLYFLAITKSKYMYKYIFNNFTKMIYLSNIYNQSHNLKTCLTRNYGKISNYIKVSILTQIRRRLYGIFDCLFTSSKQFQHYCRCSCRQCASSATIPSLG